MAQPNTPQTITVRLRVTLEVDVETYQLEYGTALPDIPSDVDVTQLEQLARSCVDLVRTW